MSMYPQFSQAKADIQEKFEGGVSFNLDWGTLAREGALGLRKKITPATIKRRVPIFGGVGSGLPILTAPTDVHTPADLFPAYHTYNGRSFTHQAPQAFYTDNGQNAYTIDYINGIPFIIANIELGSMFTLLSSADPDDLTGVQMQLNVRNFLYGNNAIAGIFTDTLFDIAWSLSQAQDLTDYRRGVIVLPFETVDTTKIAEINLYLYTDEDNYYTISSTNDVMGNKYTRGWNLARFDMATKTETGSPLISSIASCKVEIKMNTGQSQEVTIDDITLHQTHAALFEYYSTYNFRSTDGTWKEKPEEEDDIILFTDEAYEIWMYEVCMLIVQNATYDGIDSKESTRLERRLAESYQEYRRKFPSMQKPVSYNISSNL